MITIGAKLHSGIGAMPSQSFSIWTICFGLLLFANPVFSDVPIESKMVHVRMEVPTAFMKIRLLANHFSVVPSLG
jgi:hypothetical protein